MSKIVLAREVGIEPTTNRLTGDRSTAELLPNILLQYILENRRCPKYFSSEKFHDLASARLPPALRFGSLTQTSLHRYYSRIYSFKLRTFNILAENREKTTFLLDSTELKPMI